MDESVCFPLIRWNSPSYPKLLSLIQVQRLKENNCKELYQLKAVLGIASFPMKCLVWSE
ncbi:hypothetical protein SLEP1_g36304 [Rubroshorea leprosula]|uniref:Uncharacterized protein n=1 Tax=Rubroshorea leprosula TaxID=152421 RepID=A0AAV5KRJ7_9ROSI|nr:hypothetical protein SLEP1_g36304 [Rubroshorea leprosula]